MNSGIVSFLRFHFFHMLYGRPISAVLALVTALFLASSIGAWVVASRQLESASLQLAQLRERTIKSSAESRKPDLAPGVNPALPWFQSGQLSDRLRRVADDAGVPYDEVTYSLEEDFQQPFLRYRIGMTVAGGYPAVRRFVDGVAATLTNTELDAITCKRADIATVPLSCELAFSAFFRKDARG